MSSMSSMSDETTDVTVEVEVERHRASGGGEWTRIILNRPEVLNSVNRSMALSLLSALDDAASDSSVRAVMLSARGRGFCAGQDLSDVSPDEDLGAVLRERYIPCVRLMRTMDKPTIAVVNGVAAGAGANLALSADVVLASDRASFSQAFARIGLIPDAGGTWFLPRLVGSARALGLSLTAESLSAERAESWGLIWRCVPDDELESESVSLAERFADGPTFAYGLAKRALGESFGRGFDDHLELEASLQSRAGFSRDFKAGVAAFRAKESPRFTGEE